MTYKRAIAIGLLTSLGIGLLVFGIKTGTFKKQNIGKITTPISYNLNKERSKKPLQVNADNEIMPISKNWLWKYTCDIPNLGSRDTTITTPIFTTYTETQYKNFKLGSSSISYKIYNSSSSTSVASTGGGHFYNQGQRINKFEEEPTGSAITYLNQYATPLYNNNVILANNNDCLVQIRKSNIVLENTYKTDGSLIHENGIIKIYLDAGTTQFKINTIDYTTNMSGSINLTNQNIIIEAYGTAINQTANIFTINYFNTLPVIEPQPYPDASGKVTEVLDITGLMFQILTMPFTFISQAFNLTLWEGTPYQFNFSNFILSLISIATIIFIIKLFTSGFSVVGNYTSHRADTKLKKSQTKLNEAKTKKIKSKTPKKE